MALWVPVLNASPTAKKNIAVTSRAKLEEKLKTRKEKM